MSYLQAANPQLVFIDDKGQPVANGFVQTRRSVDPNQPKLVAKDLNGTQFWPQNIPLNQWGMIPGPSYWNDDEPYWMRVVKSDGETPVTTEPVFTPIGSGGGGPPITLLQDFYNHVSNPQFFDYFTIPSPLPANQDVPVAPGGWVFRKSNANATDSITFPSILLGQQAIPGNPLFAFKYECTAIGAGGETEKIFGQRIGSVNAFSNNELSVGIWAYSASSSQIEITVRQFFGTGGSPSATVDTNTTLNLTPTPTAYTAQITVPDVSGKTLGTNGDDGIFVLIKLPLNQIGDISTVNWQWVAGETLPNFAYNASPEVHALTRGEILPEPIPSNQYSPKRGMAIIVGEDGNLTYGFSAAIGEIKLIGYDATEDTGNWKGWLKINSNVSRLVSRTTYADLFALYGTTWGAGDGSTTFGLPPLGNAAMIVTNTAAPLRALGEVGGNDTRALDISNFPPLPNGGTYLVRDDTSTNDIALGASSLHLREQSGAGVPVVVKNPFCAVCAMIKY